MLGSHRLDAIVEVQHLTKLQDGCVCTVSRPAVLLTLSWFLVSYYIKNTQCVDDRKFI